MNNSVAQLCRMVSGLLARQLAEPEIDDYARSQIAAAINILCGGRPTIDSFYALVAFDHARWYRRGAFAAVAFRNLES